MVVARFVLNGQRHELDSDVVGTLMSGLEPEPIRAHAVRVSGRWYPVLQAFERATGLPRSDFTSHTARRHLAALGFELRGEIAHRNEPSRRGQAVPSTSGVVSARTDGSWPSEEAVQAHVVTALVDARWRILSVANTATKERGIDIVATQQDRRIGVEVKGFPSKHYADPRRAGETKKTQPSTQAGHWYAQAVLAAMRLRSREPAWLSVIALPDFPRYRDLYRETVGSLDAAQIVVWWVAPDGVVMMPSRDSSSS